MKRSYSSVVAPSYAVYDVSTIAPIEIARRDVDANNVAGDIIACFRQPHRAPSASPAQSLGPRS